MVAATNRKLRDLIETGQFREDLFYRLNVIHIHVPPLRERREDIPVLVDYFLDRFSKTNAHANGDALRTISSEAHEVLHDYSWPGNVRELENLVERLIVRARGPELTVDDLPVEIRAQHGVAVRPKRERRRTVADELYKRLTEKRESFWTSVYPLYMQREITRGNMRDLIRKGLEETRGNYKIVARIFNMEPTDYKRFLNFLRKHDCQLPFKDYR